MKSLSFTVALSLLTIIAIAQAPPVEEHEYSRAEYSGYESGHHKINVTNKQACAVNHFLEWQGRDTMLLIDAGISRMVDLPSADRKEIIRVKPDSRCNSSLGTEWLTVQAPIVTPLRFTYFSVRKVKKH